ncbi:MAG: GNAT family N-acetyltransferase [Colwellia sp.]
MQIKQITHATGSYWNDAISLYCKVFPQWEREPIADIEQAINSGHSRCMVLHQDNQVLGMSLTELYPSFSFAMLGYLFIAPSHQGKGLGKLLCHNLFDFFQADIDLKWLFVEAESGPEVFYARLGFTALNIKYLSPHYNNDQSTPMALMYLAKPEQNSPSKYQVCDIVEHIFLQSYYLMPTDPRLEQQRQRILSKEYL